MTDDKNVGKYEAFREFRKVSVDVYTRDGDYVGVVTARRTKTQGKGVSLVYTVAVARSAQEMFSFAH